MSHIARDLGLDLNTTWITGVEDVFHGVLLDGPPCFHCFLDAELAPGYLAWMVNDGEEVHLGVGGYAARFDPQRALERFRTRLSALVNLDGATSVERRGGRIPVGGILHHIANERGLVVGDAAGAVSPLTAGGLDPCLRLSSFAACVITNYLATENSQALSAYNGSVFRAHFRGRLWMRTLLAGMRNQMTIEAACAILRLPLFRSVTQRTFFGRGSFPNISEAQILTEGRLHSISFRA